MSSIVHVPFLGYLQIAIAAHERLIDLLSHSDRETKLERLEFSESSAGQATVTVIFVHIALESFILGYASRKLGETYAKKHVDSLGLHSKWNIVPKLATGREIPRDHRGLELLQDLVKARNSVVHLKSINIEVERWGEIQSKAGRESRQLLEAAMRSFECVGLLGTALCEMDTEEQVCKLLAGFANSPKYRIQFAEPENV